MTEIGDNIMEKNNTKQIPTNVGAENKVLAMQKAALKKALIEINRVNAQTRIERVESILSSIESVFSSSNTEELKYLSVRTIATKELLKNRKVVVDEGCVSALRIFAGEIESYLAE